MKVFLIFFMTSIGTAVLNYLFQMLLAYKLGPEIFPQFTLMWSYYSVATILGVFFQYWSSLNQLSQKHEKKLIQIAHVSSLISVVASIIWKMPYMVVAALVLESMALAFILGRAIGESDFKTVNIINVSAAVIKFFLLLILPASLINISNIFYIILASLIVTEFFSRTLRNLDKVLVKENRKDHDWKAPLLFAFLISTLPQIDILWVHWFKGQDSLGVIAELSLITKGAFFLQLIISQWLIPLQANDKFIVNKSKLKNVFLFFATLIIGSTIGACIFPIMLKSVLPGSTGQSWSLIFWAIANAGLMSLFYQTCQWNILNKKNSHVISGIGFLFVTLGVVGYFQMSMINYFIISSLTYALIEIFTLKKTIQAS